MSKQAFYPLDLQFFGKKPNTFFNMKASDDGKSADVFIYGEITKYAWEEYGEVSSLTFKNELDKLGDDVEVINLYINSPGGSVFEAMAIIAMLQRHPAEIISHIDGVAASCASVIPMISKKIVMPENSWMMIHHAMTGAWGNAKELRKAADDIERISQSMCQYYLSRAGEKLPEDELYSKLEQDTWLSAEQCLELGLCDEIAPANESVAYAFENKFAEQYKNVPKQILDVIQLGQPKPGQMSDDEQMWREKIIADSKANLTNMKLILGGI